MYLVIPFQFSISYSSLIKYMSVYIWKKNFNAYVSKNPPAMRNPVLSIYYFPKNFDSPLPASSPIDVYVIANYLRLVNKKLLESDLEKKCTHIIGPDLLTHMMGSRKYYFRNMIFKDQISFSNSTFLSKWKVYIEWSTYLMLFWHNKIE